MGHLGYYVVGLCRLTAWFRRGMGMGLSGSGSDVCVRARVEDAEQVEVGDRVPAIISNRVGGQVDVGLDIVDRLLEQRRRAVDRTGHVVGPAHIVELRDQLLYLP
eukprot:7179867-Prymnesium_polylepis.1